MRDCSCRGSSGYAHLSCIVRHAENEGKRTVESGEVYTAACFAKAFEFCPNCKQQYQNDMIYNLTKAAVEFTDREYKDISCGYLHLHTLSNRLTVLDGKNADDKVEGEVYCTKIVSIIEEMKNDNYLLENWKELTYVYTEAAAYGGIGHFNETIDTEESLVKAKQYLERARDIFREMGDEMPMLIAEKKIAGIDAKISGEENLCVDTLRKIYAYLRKTIGETDPSTIHAGIDVAEALCLSYHSIEAERLLTKLVEASRRVHGSQHEVSRCTASYLQRMKERVVITRDNAPFIAIRYEGDLLHGDRAVCVVKDPIAGREINLLASDVIPYLGTPVICNGNKKIGDVRRVDVDIGACEVHFEEAGLGPLEVKSDNLAILFDLPPVN